MSNKGNNRHVKRLAASKYMGIERKTSAYVVKPAPGRHTLDANIAITTVLKEKLHVAGNSKESRTLLKAGKIFVNGKVVKEEKYPVGFGDVIFLKPSDSHYKVGVGRYGTFNIEKVAKKDAEEITCKVIGKYVSKGGKLMMRLHTGAIMPAEKSVNVNDSVTLLGDKVKSVIKLAPGTKCIVYKGVHAPIHGSIKSIKHGSMVRDATAEIESGKERFETTVDNIIAVGA